MNVLAIDTAGPVVGVALFVDGGSSERSERIARGAEGRLLPWAEELLAEAGLRLSDLDGVAVAVGPGAFTGLRVGLASAGGLAMALGVPLWGGSSLDARAAAVAHTPLLTMLDARKGKVYAARYDDGVLTQGPADLPPNEALAWMSEPFVATGEGAVVYAEEVGLAGGRVVDDASAVCTGYLARLGAEGIGRGEGGAPESVAPVYLREPDAKPSNKGRILRGP